MSNAGTESFTRLHQAPALVCAFVAFIASCQSSEGATPPPAPPLDSGSADTGADVSDASDASPPPVLNITLSPKTLTPAFSPSIQDYYVRCAAGSNPATLDVTYSSGDQAMPVILVENQELVVAGRYQIRCVPHNFPPLTVNSASGGPTPGWFLITSSTYAIVLDTNGTPVWYAAGTSMINLDAPGPNTLSFMPNVTAPYGTSASSKYEINALTATTSSVMAVGNPTDGHELRLLPNGNRLVLTYPIESHVDLTGLQTFGSDETIADCEVQEVDPSGNLVWSWLATDHVDPVQESLEPAANMLNGVSVVDVFHFNSIEVETSGNLLLSSRHANALFYVDRPSGTVEWKLGGTSYNKDDATHINVVGDSQTTFNMQHDARFRSNGDITLFDDHGANSTGVARGVEYSIDHGTNTASVVFQYLGGGRSQYEGSFRRYPDQHSVIGWGYIPGLPRVLTEVDENGNDVFDIALGGQVSYRAVKVPAAQLDIGMMRATAGH